MPEDSTNEVLKVAITKDTMYDIADAVRSKLQVSTTYLPSQMAEAIMSIQAFKPEETFTAIPTTLQQTITPSVSGHVFSEGIVNPIYEDVSNTADLEAKLDDAKNVNRMYRYTGATTADYSYCHNGLYIADIQVSLPSLQTDTFTYSKSTITPTVITPDSGDYYTISGDTSATVVGNYSIIVALKVPGLCWTDGTSEAKTLNWSINVLSLPIPTFTNSNLPYTGASQSPEINDFNSEHETQTGTDTALELGNYSLTWSLQDTVNTCWSDNTTTDKVGTWNIIKASVAIPYLTDTEKTYNGNEQAPTINDFDSEYVNQDGTAKETELGTWIIYWTLKDSTHYSWSDGTIETKSANWTISKLVLAIPYLTDASKTYNGSSQKPTINDYNSTWETQSGISFTAGAGNYTITWSLKDTTHTQWTDETTTDKTGEWSIAKLKLTIPSVSQSEFYYNGYSQGPSIYNFNSAYETQGGYSSAVNAATYRVYWNLQDLNNTSWTDNTTEEKSDYWRINKVNSSITTAPTAKGGTYTGSAIALVNVGVCTGGTMYYKAANSSQTSYGTSIPTATAVGTYTVYYYCKGDTNHNDSSEFSVTASITSASTTIPQVTVASNPTYNGSEQSPTWNNYDSTKMTINGTYAATDVGTYTAYFTVKSGYSWEGTTASTISVQWSIVAKPSRNLTLSSSSVTISTNNPKTVTVSYNGDSGTLYFNSTKTKTVDETRYTATISGDASGSTITVKRKSGTTTGTNTEYIILTGDSTYDATYVILTIIST